MRYSGPARLTAALAVGLALAAPAAQAQQGGSGVPVSAVRVKPQNVPVLARGIGTVQAYYQVLVRARVDGTLDSVNFTEGQEVKRGDLLAQIDPRPFQAALDQAQAKKTADEAQVANARRDLNRYSEVARNGFASRQQVDTQTSSVAQMEAALKGDDAAIAMATLNLSYARITSPIDGRVGLRLTDPGNMIRAADQNTVGIVMVSQIHPITATFALPQDSLPAVQSAIQQGRETRLAVEAWSGDDRTLLGKGELLTLDNAIDQASGTIKLKAVFANAENKLWPGQFINARLRLNTLENALTVPSAAINRGPAGLYVYVVKPDSSVAVQPVEMLQDDGGIAVVTKGLEADTPVVTAGQSRLRDGTRVTVNEAKPGA